MSKLNEFLALLAGRFNNAGQFRAKQESGQTFPYAEHVNTLCNDKIRDLPPDFAGAFMLEESYYTTNGKTHPSHHLFLFTEEPEGIRLTSYEAPEGYGKDDFTYANLREVDYASLKPSAKFTPALYTEKDGVWEGGSVSQFTPALKFTLWERFSSEGLEVSESMEMNGRPTFGYGEPILYKRADPAQKAAQVGPRAAAPGASPRAAAFFCFFNSFWAEGRLQRAACIRIERPLPALAR